MSKTSAREAACFERLQVLRRAALRNAIEDLDAGRSHGFEFPLAGFQGLERPLGSAGWLRQILLLPFALLVVALMLLITPISYLAHLRHRRGARRALETQLRALDVWRVELPPTMPKTLRDLWFAWQVEHCDLVADDELQLIGDWVEILYGTSTKQALQILERVDTIRNRCAAAYNAAAAKGVLISFIPVGRALVDEISDALPPYQAHDNDRR